MSTQKDTSAAVLIGIVSPTGDLSANEGCNAMANGLEKAGHKVLKRVAVDGSTRAVRRFILDAQDQVNVSAVVVLGGTGLSSEDSSYEAVTGFIDKEIPGFGQALRAMLLSKLRSKAMCIRAAGGVLGQVPVFVLPGDTATCQVAGEQLIGPELSAILADVRRAPIADEEYLGPADDEAEVGESVEEASSKEVVEEEIPEGWLRRLHEIGGSLNPDAFPDLPAWLEELSAAKDVLNNAGQRGIARLPSGNYVALGFPDLSSPRSRVLLLGQRSPRDEILALHRWPMPTGVCATRVGGLIPHRGRMGKTAEEITGVDYPGDGRLFAVEADSVYILDGAYVQAWDGKNTRGHGLEASALASLLLRWTQH